MLVAVTDTIATDYPGDNRCRCYQPPQAGPGVTKLTRAAPGCVVGRAGPGWAVAGRGSTVGGDGSALSEGLCGLHEGAKSGGHANTL